MVLFLSEALRVRRLKRTAHRVCQIVLRADEVLLLSLRTRGSCVRSQIDGNSVCMLRGLGLPCSVLVTLAELIVQIQLHRRLGAARLAQNLLLIVVRDVERLNAARVSRLLETSLSLMTSHYLTIACDTAAAPSTGLLALFVWALIASRELVCYGRHLIFGRVGETSDESIVVHRLANLQATFQNRTAIRLLRLARQVSRRANRHGATSDFLLSIGGVSTLPHVL